MAKEGKSTVVPRLRFPEFQTAEGWETKLLGDVCRPQQWATISSFELSEAGFPVYGANGFIGYYSAYNHEFETVAITCRGSTCGEVLLIPAKSYVTGNSMCLDDIDARQDSYRFFYQLLKYRGFRDVISGSAQPQIVGNAIKKLKIAVPGIREQQKIADCLTSLDEVIAAQDRFVAALKTYKRGLMQQLFPREGETLPRLRFPEFRDRPEWEKVPLGDIAEIKLGKMLDANKHKTGRLLPYINNISLRWNDVDTSNLPQMYFNDDDELERYGLKAGDILVCEGGEPGRSAVWDGQLPDLKFQKAIHRVRFRIPFESRLLVLYLEAVAGTTAFESLFTGGGIKHLTLETFSRFQIPCIPLAEQRRVANCLSSLGDQIASEIEKLETLKTHKKGLMQQLFPAPEEASA